MATKNSTAKLRSTDPLLQLRATARRDPVTFAREVLLHKRLPGEKSLAEDPQQSWELDIFQVDLLNAIADVWRKLDGAKTVINHEGKNFITVRAAHGPGKTHTVALLAHVFNAAFDGRIVCVAPKFAQLKTRLWGAFRRIDMRAEQWYRYLYEINDTTVHWMCVDPKTGKVVPDKNHCMLAETANKPENLAGHHEQFQLVIIDEGSGIPESLVPTILGALSVGVVQILVMVGNPTRETGYFADSHRKRETANEFFRYHVNAENSLRMRGRTHVEWAKKLIARYGETSPVVRVRVKGEFPGSSPNQLVALEWIQAARDREIDPMIGDGSLPKLRISVDCGAGGTGETVCTAARRFTNLRVGLKQTRHNFPLATASKDTADAAENLFRLFGGRKGIDDIVVDSLGVGVGAAGYLVERGHSVVLYQGGSSSDDPKRWRCRRVQSYLVARDDFKDGLVTFLESFYDDVLDWDDFDAQMCSIQLRDSDKVEDIMTKKDMTEKGIPSPDLSDSWIMQYATQAPTLRPGPKQSEQADVIPLLSSTEGVHW